MIGMDPEECERPEFAAVFSGNAPVPQGVRPYAQNYGGHQFGMVHLSRVAHDWFCQAVPHLSPAAHKGSAELCHTPFAWPPAPSCLEYALDYHGRSMEANWIKVCCEGQSMQADADPQRSSILPLV